MRDHRDGDEGESGLSYSGGRAEGSARPRVVAFGAARADIDEVLALRKAPGRAGAPKVAPSLIKHADDQAAVGVAAVLNAMVDFGLSEWSFEDWSVLAAPRYMGRVHAAALIDRYRRQGAGSVSPLIIPYLSLHSMSGTISMALGCRGTNFGIGGSPGHIQEAFLAAMAASKDTPGGQWLVITGWEPEPAPNLARQSRIPATCYAAALALDPAGCLGLEAVGELSLSAAPLPAASGEADGGSPLVELVEFLSAGRCLSTRVTWGLTGPGFRVELSLDPSESATRTLAG